MFEMVIATLATFGISAIISNYDGPFNILTCLRAKVSAARCCVCMAVWLAIPIAVSLNIGLIGYLAILGSVILLERVT